MSLFYRIWHRLACGHYASDMPCASTQHSAQNRAILMTPNTFFPFRSFHEHPEFQRAGRRCSLVAERLQRRPGCCASDVRPRAARLYVSPPDTVVQLQLARAKPENGVYGCGAHGQAQWPDGGVITW